MATLTGAAIVAEVEKFAGDRYVYGGTGPSTFDCSGLVQYVLTTLGVKGVPRDSEDQWAWVQKVSASQLAPGDLVFAQFPGDNASPGHVGIYVGNGRVLSAEDEALGVGYATLSSWSGHIVGYGRVPDASVTADTTTTSALGGLGGIVGLPLELLNFFGDFDKALGASWGALTDLFAPSTWIRAAAGAGGLVLLIAGLWFLVKAAAS